MKQIVIAFLIILGLSPAILAQEGFKITGRLGGSLGGNLVLVGSSSEGAVKLGETTMIAVSYTHLAYRFPDNTTFRVRVQWFYQLQKLGI